MSIAMILFYIFGALATIYLILDFFFFHNFSDGPAGVKRALMAPIYYFFGYECECGKKFLSSKEAYKHMKNCGTHQTHEYFRKSGGWWPRF